MVPQWHFFLWVFVIFALSENLHAHQHVHVRKQTWDVGFPGWRRLPASPLYQSYETRERVNMRKGSTWQKIPEQSVIRSWKHLNGSYQKEKTRKEKFSRNFCWCGGGPQGCVHDGTLLHRLTAAEVCRGLAVCLWASYCRVNQPGSSQRHPSKWGVSPRQVFSYTEREKWDAGC